MRAILHTDPSRGPGFGIIEIPGGAADGQPTFLLHRASDGLSLSPGGWQEAETELTPEDWDDDGGTLRLVVGPAVVDNMDALDTYRLTLRAGNTASCVLTVRDIAYSALHGGQGIATARPIPPPVEPESLSPAPASEPVPETPSPMGDATLDMPPPATEERPRPRGKGLLIPGLLFFLLLCGGAAWWFLLRSADAPMARDPARTPLVAGNATRQDAPSTPATPKPQSAPPAPLTMAREHLKAGGDPAQSLKLARDMDTPEAADAAFLLVEDAAQKGNTEAMLRLAAFYDPVDTRPKGSIMTDPAQARLWYSRAKDNGNAAAALALAALRARLEADAAKGHNDAKAVLREWK